MSEIDESETVVPVSFERHHKEAMLLLELITAAKHQSEILANWARHFQGGYIPNLKTVDAIESELVAFGLKFREACIALRPVYERTQATKGEKRTRVVQLDTVKVERLKE